MSMLVRLKPYNPRRGFKLKRLMFRSTKYVGADGWYRVNNATAEALRDLRQDQYDDESPAAFDVMTQEAAEELEEREKAKQVATASKPKIARDFTKNARAGALTSADLPDGQPEVADEEVAAPPPPSAHDGGKRKRREA